MAKCMIIFEDTDDGGMSMNIKFDPPIETDFIESPTKAQETGLSLFDALSNDNYERDEEEY